MAAVQVHLNDIMCQAQWLLEALSNQNLAAVSTLTQQILAKNGHIQTIVTHLIGIYEAEERISDMKKRIENVDSRIIAFASQLGNLESSLYESVLEIPKCVNIDGKSRNETCSVQDLLVLSERLALVSSAPADFIEHNGVSICRPPAPLEDLMAASRLHLSVEELRQQLSTSDGTQSGAAVDQQTPSIHPANDVISDLFTDEVPEDWDEDMSDFDADEVTRSWMDASGLKQS
uniref:Mediator of RNA polymerase II transcription subunit 4 n=1 Tax=Spongospora subterranea TaxID=70186 RepID=A0A0H5R7F9_9EUKA|eukprot:CRZ10085.1 hypothetical protein [Spongospora subterranea]